MQRQPVSDRLQPVEPDFVGRNAELEALQTLLDPQGPGVMHVHGIAGIGKSRLLDVFAGLARAEETTIVKLDCRTMEPTREGFLEELGAAVGGRAGNFRETCARLGELGARVLLVLDTYEVYRLMDTWLRQVFVPALPDNVRLLCPGRERPLTAWRTAPGVRFHALALGPLEETEANRLPTRYGVPAKAAARIAHATHGHPLALQLVASAYAEWPDLAFEEVSRWCVRPSFPAAPRAWP